MIIIEEVRLNIDDMKDALSLLSKKIKKRFGRDYRLNLYLVGGASMLFNSYREQTQDIDAYFSCDKYDRSDILTLIYEVADELNLNTKWLNDDFKNTNSYSTNLINPKCYTFLQTFNQCLRIYTVKPIYILCMKLKSFRSDSNDISDIKQIITQNDFTFEDIENAYKYLYNVDLIVDLNTDIVDFVKTLLKQ